MRSQRTAGRSSTAAHVIHMPRHVLASPGMWTSRGSPSPNLKSVILKSVVPVAIKPSAPATLQVPTIHSHKQLRALPVFGGLVANVRQELFISKRTGSESAGSGPLLSRHTTSQHDQWLHGALKLQRGSATGIIVAKDFLTKQ